MLHGSRILLIVSGSVSAYKALELARLLGKAGAEVTGLLTPGGARFVTPHALQAITGRPLARDLWDLEEEGAGRGHIRLARDHDLVVVAPASASRIARMATGLADDLAGAALLATRAPILLAPAMNPAMWEHPATRANLATLVARGATVVGPEDGPMAERESGIGRLSEPPAILAAIVATIAARRAPPAPPLATPPFAARPLEGRRVLVTAGPTQEAIDPVRFIANRSSGKQGSAIAAALAALGAEVVLVRGPGHEPAPQGVELRPVVSARDMLAACEAALPADAAVFAAAVADWRPAAVAAGKIKKRDGAAPPALELVPNPDILATIARLGPGRRPGLVVGFAAETSEVLDNARAKLARKGCDWIVANDVSGDVFGGAENTVHLVTRDGVEDWPRLAKGEVARRLAARIAAALDPGTAPA